MLPFSPCPEGVFSLPYLRAPTCSLKPSLPAGAGLPLSTFVIQVEEEAKVTANFPLSRERQDP